MSAPALAPLERLEDARVEEPGAIRARATGTRALAVLAGMVAAYTGLFAGISLIKHRHYLYDDFDLAIFTQALAQLGRGSTFVSIRGMSWLGDHSSLVLFLLAPLYALAPRPETLLVVQSLALGLGAIPVFRIARRGLHSESAALMFAAAYLAYPAVGYTNLFEFHPETLATPALLAAFDALLEGRTRRAVLWGVLALLAKEDVALVVGGLGAWSLLRGPRGRHAGVWLCALAAASLVLSFAVLKPLGNGGQAEYGRMYAGVGGSPGAFLGALAADPLGVLARLVDTPGRPLDGALKREMLLHLMLPLAFLPLLAPLVLAIALPIVAAHLLSARVQQHTIVFQYTALVTPVLVVAAIQGAARLGQRWPDARRPLLLALALATLAGQLLFGPFGAGLQRSRRPQPVAPDAAATAMARHHDRLVAAVPRSGTVVSGFETLAHFAPRPSVHALHHVVSGRFTYSSRAYPLPRDAVAVVGDLAATRLLAHVDEGSAARLRAVLATGGLSVADAAGDLLLFDRDPATPPLELIGPSSTAAEATPSTPVTVDGVLKWLGAEPLRVQGDGLVEIHTLWERVARVDHLYMMELAVVNERGAIAHRHRRWLGYIVWPPTVWSLGESMRERYRLVLPDRLPPGEYRVAMRMLRKQGQSLASATLQPSTEWVLLGRFRR